MSSSSSLPPEALTSLRESFERYVSMPDAVWAELRRPWCLHSVRRGERLTEAGEVERQFSLILQGVQRAYFLTGEGDEVTVAFAYPPDYSGVPDSFFLQKPAAHTLEALTDGRIATIDHADFSALLDRPDRFRAFHEGFETRFPGRGLALSGRAQRERDLLTLSAEERYRQLLERSPQLLQLVPLKHVASYLGMSPETLSRVRAAIS